MRVLATFPELVSRPDVRDRGAGGAVPLRQTPTSDPRPSRPTRVTPRPRFPTGSAVALGLLAAALWTLVAFREAPRSEGGRPEVRLAAEPAGSTTGTTR